MNRRLRFSSDADIVRLTNARIIIIINDQHGTIPVFAPATDVDDSWDRDTVDVPAVVTDLSSVADNAAGAASAVQIKQSMKMKTIQ